MNLSRMPSCIVQSDPGIHQYHDQDKSATDDEWMNDWMNGWMNEYTFAVFFFKE